MMRESKIYLNRTQMSFECLSSRFQKKRSESEIKHDLKLMSIMIGTNGIISVPV